MSHFSELCELSAAVEEKRQSVNAIIRREAVRLVGFYEKWLELPAQSWVDTKGVRHLYVEAGQYDHEGIFQPWSARAVKVGEDGSLNIVVKTAIGSDPSTPDISIPVNLRLLSAGELGLDIAVEVNGDKPVSVFVRATDECAYSEVAARIKRHIQDAVKRRYPAALL